MTKRNSIASSTNWSSDSYDDDDDDGKLKLKSELESESGSELESESELGSDGESDGLSQQSQSSYLRDQEESVGLIRFDKLQKVSESWVGQFSLVQSV